MDSIRPQSGQAQFFVPLWITRQCLLRLLRDENCLLQCRQAKAFPSACSRKRCAFRYELDAKVRPHRSQSNRGRSVASSRDVSSLPSWAAMDVGAVDEEGADDKDEVEREEVEEAAVEDKKCAVLGG